MGNTIEEIVLKTYINKDPIHDFEVMFYSAEISTDDVMDIARSVLKSHLSHLLGKTKYKLNISYWSKNGDLDSYKWYRVYIDVEIS